MINVTCPDTVRGRHQGDARKVPSGAGTVHMSCVLYCHLDKRAWATRSLIRSIVTLQDEAIQVGERHKVLV